MHDASPLAKRPRVGPRRPGVLAAAFCLLALSAALADATTLTSSEYADRLDRAAWGVEHAARLGKSASPSAEEALSEVPARAEVRASGAGAAIPVDNRDLLAGLRRKVRSGPAGIKEAAETLRSLQAGVTEHAPAAPEGREALTRVLARREFHLSWLQRMRMKLSEMWGRALRYVLERFPSLPKGMHVPAGLPRIVGYAALALAALVVALLVVRLVMRFTGVPLPAEAMLASKAEEPRRPHGEWLAEADRMLRTRQYNAAVRALYLASLMRLDETGRLSYDRARADGRFVRALELRGDPELAGQLSELSRLFSRIWYGLAPAGEQEYGRAQQLWSRLEAMTAS